MKKVNPLYAPFGEGGFKFYGKTFNLRKHCLLIEPRQKNTWVVFGTGKAPSVWYKAISAA